MGLKARNKNSVVLILALFFNLIAAKSQTSVLDTYIEQGLENNLALQQKTDSYQQSIQDLREARGMFFPSLSFDARATVAEGGRTIEFPVGDLLNPVYSTLNMLTSSNQFSELTNEAIPFLRPFEHETKLQVVQPLYNPQIYYNHKIKSNLTQAAMADAGAYKRHLVCEIKTAYYNYLKAVQFNDLLNNTKRLLEENIRVSERLYANDKITIDNVYRSKTELSKLEQQKAEALKLENSAAAYFNFLLNRPLTDSIEIEKDPLIQEPGYSIDELKKNALDTREELKMLKSYSKAAGNNLRLNKSLKLPTLLGVVDYGFQGEKYSFTGEDDYMMASLVLRWNIFTGMQNNARIKKAQINREITEKKFQELEAAIQLEITNAWYALQASRKSIETAQMQSESSQKAYHIVSKKYDQGQANLIEYIDARTSMTNAGENLIMARYDYLIKMADYERAAGLYNF